MKKLGAISKNSMSQYEKVLLYMKSIKVKSNILELEYQVAIILIAVQTILIYDL